MEFGQLKDQLQTSLLKSADIEELYQDFCDKLGSEDLEFFLEHLHFQDLIDDETYQTFMGQTGVSLSEVPDLTFYGQLKAKSEQDIDQEGTLVKPTSSDLTSSENRNSSPLNDPASLAEYIKENFTFIDQIGEGAMGKIHLVKENNLQRKIAFKTLHESMAGDPTILNRFLNEVQITAQLDHPNIVPIYGLVQTDSGLAYSMKLIKGKTLKELIKDAQNCVREGKPVADEFSQSTFLEHFLKLCDAVEFAHSKHVLHRDLKPENVMIGPYNEVYLMDWGIAKVIGAEEGSAENFSISDEDQMLDTSSLKLNMTAFNELLGTPRYMSPEQIMAKPSELTLLSDVYAMGVILYEMICLKPAFDAGTVRELFDKIMGGDRLPVEHLNSSTPIPFELKAIIEKASHCLVTERYASVKEMADDIRRFLRGEAILARPDTSFQKILRWISRNRQTTLIMMMAIIVVSSALVSWSFYKRHTDHLAAQLREDKLANFLNIVRDKSQFLNYKFLEFEGLTLGFATSVEQLLEYGVEHEKYYTVRASERGDEPPNLKPSSVYALDTTLDDIVFKLAPEVNTPDVAASLKRLSQLSPHLKRLLLLSYDQKSLNLSSQEADDLIRNTRVPAIDIYAGFEEGFSFTYPGRMKYNPDYDGRKRPWYQITKGKKGLLWGKPYVDTAGLGWVVPCTKSLYDSNNQFRGVVGIDMLIETLNQYMAIDKPYIKDVFLINEEGEIIIQGSEKKQYHKAGTLINQHLTLKPFHIEEVLHAFNKKQASGFVHQKSNKNIIYTFNRLSSTNWYYLVEADSQEMFLSLE